MRRLLSFALVASVLSGGFYSRADTSPNVDLTWQAPPGCPTAESVQREVERVLGAAADKGNRLVATAVVTRSERGWALVLTTKVRGIEGRRVVEARSCEALSQALTIVLALTIDPSRSVEAIVDDGGANAAPVPASANSEPDAGSVDGRVGGPVDGGAVQQAELSTSAGAPTELSLGAGVAANIGALPRVALAPELSGGWLRGGFRLDLSFAYFPAVRSLLDATRGGDFALATGALRGCKLWGNAGLALGPCLAIEGGALTGEGVGVRFVGSDVAPWMAARAGGLLATRLGTSSLWLLLSVEAEVPVLRYRFQLDAVGIVHQPSAVAGRAAFGGEVRF